nr:hypothetical protein RNT25_01383 [arsenite-oxidising bacterium NT-25]
MPDWLVYVIAALALFFALASIVGHAARWMGWV